MATTLQTSKLDRRIRQILTPNFTPSRRHVPTIFFSWWPKSSESAEKKPKVTSLHQVTTQIQRPRSFQPRNGTTFRTLPSSKSLKRGCLKVKLICYCTNEWNKNFQSSAQCFSITLSSTYCSIIVDFIVNIEICRFTITTLVPIATLSST